MDENIKINLSKIMILISLVSIALVFGTAGSGSRPFIPSIAFLFKWPLGILFLLAQLIFCCYFRIKHGLLVILAVWMIMVPSIYLGSLFRWSSVALSGFDRIVTGSSCAGALVLGIGVIKKKL